MIQSSNQRKYDRLNEEFSVRMSNLDYATKKIVQIFDTSTAINVSGGGMLVRSSEIIEPGTTVSLIFMKPNSFDFYKGFGKVVRLERSSENNYNVALNFIDQSPEESTMLDYCIRLGKRP